MLTNYLGPFLLTLGLLPCLRKAMADGGDSRIINVTSSMHQVADLDLENPFLEHPGSYASDKAYSNSKLAQVRFKSITHLRME